MKPCAKCKEVKPFTDFTPSKFTKSGYRSYCKKCANEITKERYVPKSVKDYRVATVVTPCDDCLKHNYRYLRENPCTHQDVTIKK